MPTVAVNAPKTPVTKGSNGIAMATLPNICKMPGPPAPFVPVPLPNIGTSDNAPLGYSTTVQIEGNPVAIQGASFLSKGDIASLGTGGGIVSNNAQGPTTFLGPGSFDVRIENKNVQLLADPMLNNNGPPGAPALYLYLEKGSARSTAHIALTAQRKAQVRAFHEQGLRAGGKDNGPPGIRTDYAPDYYAAFLIDPEGNNLEAVCFSHD